ncbi:hypothetical protein B296_00048980 [Ensete ventricosum]|uniref:Uncharacterized protein n=1 Tax=Ensete ventricosum TaxID=4639 RepID=A0A426X1U6_ENSVE|nr:hypothetical protein B296_00048980 [Ensete ventricosum]
MSMVSRKNSSAINFARSRAQSRASIDFSCTVSEIQNTGHSQRISPWEVRIRFHKKNDCQKICVKLHFELSSDRFFMHRLRNPKYWPFPIY